MKKVKEAQEKILNGEPPKKKKHPVKKQECLKFGEMVVGGVYDETLWKQNIKAIQDNITIMEETPRLFNESIDLIDSIQKEAGLNMVLGFVIDVCEKVHRYFRTSQINARQFKDKVSELIGEVYKLGMFDLGDVDRCVEGQQLDSLRARYDEGCTRIITEAKKVLEKLQGTSATS